jgi:hypothetical protein
MKYIKTYENKNRGVFYYIPYTNELFEIAINKLPISEEIKKVIIKVIISDWLGMRKFDIGIYISMPGVYSCTTFSYYKVSDREDKIKAEELYLKHDFTFKGEIKLEDWEITAYKYNL